MRTAVSDGAGRFAVEGLPAGSYDVEVALASFTTEKREGVSVGESIVDLGTLSLSIAGLGETVVVSASRVESTLTNAPATMSVLSADTIDSAPASNMGDLLRAVPGVNVTQMSARDVQLSSRSSTGTLDASQIALLDGRSIYLDFFGLVLWDLVPSNKDDIKQIEVVRGPASAVWGANALTGVVNIITKSPREGQGFNLILQGGGAGRDVGSRAGESMAEQYGVHARWADAPSERFSYRLSGGYFQSDPYARPVGQIPLDTHPLDSSIVTGGAPYPADQAGTIGAFANEGTKQPKAEVRLDYEFEDGGRLSGGGGYAGTTGIIHSGIGPFDIQSGSYMGYGRVGYQKGAFKVGAFLNWLDVEAPNLLLPDPFTGGPVLLNFNTQTLDFEVGNSSVVSDTLVLTYGGNLRRNNFEITLTPNVEDRNEIGGYLQAEYFVDKFRVVAGGRVDKFGNIDDPVFSPRVSLMFKPAPEHAFRVSFNRAFRSPSAVNNYLDQSIFAPQFVDLRALRPFVPPPLCPAICGLVDNPFPLIVRNVGNEVGGTVLKEEKLDAIELGYTGTIDGKTTISVALYQNDSDDNINFTQVTPDVFPPAGIPPFDVYSPASPPTLPPPFNQLGNASLLLAFLQQVPPPFGPILLPRTVSTYLNLSGVRNRGVELGVDHSFTRDLSGFVNYSWQDEPELLEPDADEIRQPVDEIALPPTNRFNIGLNYSGPRYIGSASYNYQDEAFWVDVLSREYHGGTDSFGMFNASFGVRFADGKATVMLKATNLFDETIQQHIFGDLLKRSFMAELRLNLP
jgi:outer membrane receptor protein involved in Fe transport